jgi:O-antigen/teichoic acid export membrane protein
MSLPYLWMRVFSAFSDQIPVLLLNKQSGNIQVGYFAVGFRLIIPITLAISTGLRAIFPFFTKLYFEDKAEFDRKLINGFGFVLIWGTIVATLLVTTSQIWIPIVLGKAYINAIAPFNILAWFGVGLSFDMVLSTVLSSTYKQNTLAIITTIDFLVMFPLLYLGSKYGATGLANAKLFGMLIVILYHIIVIVKLLRINISNISFYASFIFFLAMMFTNIFIDSLLVKIILSLLIFLVLFSIKKSPLRQNIQFVFVKLKSFRKGDSI